MNVKGFQSAMSDKIKRGELEIDLWLVSYSLVCKSALRSPKCLRGGISGRARSICLL